MKLKFITCMALALASALFTITAAQATTAPWEGNATGAPTYNRLFMLDTVAGVGTAVAYNSFTFSVSTPGLYAFQSIAAFENFLTLYGGSFQPAMPLLNARALNDDLGTLGASGFSFTLLANTPYIAVTTGYANTDFGQYRNAITGLGTVSFVPEPERCELLALGLMAIGVLKRLRDDPLGR